MATPRLLSGRYEIVRRLRVGRIVQVYEGIDQRDQQRVAIELLRDVLSNDQAATVRFMEAARTSARLVHPHIAKVYATEEEQGVGFVVRELVDGPCLRDLISSEGQLKPAQATSIAVEVCEALELAHSHGVLHGCPTPSEILLTEDDHVKVVGFGVAASIGTADGFDVRYRAPEQARMAGDQRSDLYTLGCTLYEMLLGRAPFHGDPQLAERLSARVPAELAAITIRLLAEQPEDRYQDAAEAKADLSDYLATVAAPARGRGAHVRPSSGPRFEGITSPIRGSAALVGSCAVLAIAAIAAATQVDLGSEQAVSGGESVSEADSDLTSPTGAGLTDSDDDESSTIGSTTTERDEKRDKDDKKDEDAKESKQDKEGEDAEDDGESGDEEGTPRTTDGPGETTTTSSDPGPPSSTSPSTTEAPSTVPSVVGMSESQARSTLASHGLSMSTQRVRVYNTGQDGKVISQSPGGGAPHPSDGTVSVQVGQWCLLIC